MNSQIHTEKHRPFPIPETHGYMYIYIYIIPQAFVGELGSSFYTSSLQTVACLSDSDFTWNISGKDHFKSCFKTELT